MQLVQSLCIYTWILVLTYCADCMRTVVHITKLCDIFATAYTACIYHLHALEHLRDDSTVNIRKISNYCYCNMFTL